MQNSGQVVLVVEDNELNMKLFRDLLEVQGYKLEEATNGMDVHEWNNYNSIP